MRTEYAVVCRSTIDRMYSAGIAHGSTIHLEVAKAMGRPVETCQGAWQVEPGSPEGSNQAKRLADFRRQV